MTPAPSRKKGEAKPTVPAAKPPPTPDDLPPMPAAFSPDLAADAPAETAAGKPDKPAAIAADGKVNQQGLIDQYLPYVRSIAGKIKKSLAKEIEFDDLVEYGMVGLLEAATRFDPRFGANFMTFSYYRIRGAIYDGLRNMGWVSRNEYARFRFEERANSYLTNVAERIAVGDEGKSAEDEVTELAEAVQNLVTIYVTSLEGIEGLQLQDVEAEPIDIKVGDVQMKKYVRDALDRLPEQERTLLKMYYFKEMSLQEVGDALGLSKSWTSRLHAKAVEKLSRLLRELIHDDD